MNYLRIDPLSLRDGSVFQNCSHIPGPRRIIAVFEFGLLKGHITTNLRSCRLIVPLLPFFPCHIYNLQLDY